MRFIHTADVHLSGDAPHRLEVFKEVCRLAAGADGLVISGDLFHSGEAVRDRSLLAAAKDALALAGAKPVLVIPGNHEFLRLAGGEPYAGLDLGGHVRLVRGSRQEAELSGVRFALIPFQPGASRERARPPDDKGPWVAVFHGTAVDRPGLSMAALESGDDADSGDALLRDADLSGFCYAALGHIHRFDRWEAGSCLASYPGSPDYVSAAESEERTVNSVTVDAEGKARLERLPLATAHRALECRVLVLPGLRAQAEARARELVEGARPGQVPVLRLVGIAPREEAAALAAALESAFQGRSPRPVVKDRVLDSGGLDAGDVVDELFRRLGALENKDPVHAGRVAYLAMRALSGEPIGSDLEEGADAAD